MTRLQKLRLRGISIYCFDFLFIILVELAHMQFRVPTFLLDHYTAYRVGLVICVIVVVAQIWLNQRKQKAIPTLDELAAHSAQNREFNNSFEWLHLFATLFLILFAFFILTLPVPCEHIYEHFQFLPLKLWFLVALTCIITTIPDFLHFKNQYLIEGDTLIIREGHIPGKNLDLRIPLDTIDEVYLNNTWNTRPKLFINVNGIHRQLHATTHIVELAVYLSCCIHNKK